MRRKPIWWTFLRINEDGWSSGFESVNLLLKHLGRKSRSVASRNNYCYILWRICKRAGMNPDELVSKACENPAEVANLIQDLADECNSKKSTRYANHIVHIAKSVFKVNKVDLDLHGFFQPVRSRKRPEYIPSLQEALRMADIAGSLRDRLIILFLIYTGLRNSTLRALVYNESYPDPLLQEHTIKKELERGKACLIIIVHEVMKKRVPNACKDRTFYYTFIPPKVAESLRLYLQERKEKYGDILDHEPIFITKNRRISLSERRKTPISSRELQEIVKKAAKRSGIKNWKYVYPHCLRKTYESFLRNQPDDVKLDVKEREFLFGHILPGSQDTYFDNTKIEEIRAKYAKMVFEPIASVKTDERVICEDELQTFLQQGWHFEATLPSGKVVVSRRTIVKQLEEPKTTSPSEVYVQKEKSQEGLKSLDQNQTPLVNCSDAINRPTPKNINQERNQVSKNRGGQPNLPMWTSPLKPEPSPNSETKPEPTSSFSSKSAVEEEKNRSNKTKQKSLFDFPI